MNNFAPYTPIVIDVKTTPKCNRCNDTGEQRYWEGRWRDEKAENERLRAAATAVEEWWLSEGMKHFDGAPYAIFAIRAALVPQQLAPTEK